TIALRRVNYYEDYQFADIFEPHPDFPGKLQLREVCVDAQPLMRYMEFLRLPNRGYLERSATFGIQEWLIAGGEIVSAGDPVAKTNEGAIRAPRAGMVMAVPGRDSKDGLPNGPLFSLRYFEDGTAATSPFADIIASCQEDYKIFLMHVRERKAAARTWFIFGGLALLLWRYIGAAALI